MRGINQIKTAALLGLLSGLLVLAGYYLIGNEQGLYLTSMAYQAQPLAREQLKL